MWAEPSVTIAPLETSPSWTLWTRVAFRYVFVTLCLMLIVGGRSWGSATLAAPGLLGTFFGVISAPGDYVWPAVVSWFSLHVLHLEEPLSMAPDGPYVWAQAACIAALAALATLIWSLSDRRRRHYASLHEASRIAVRFVLGSTMFAYGFAKLAGLQFSSNMTYHRLLTPVGDMSPAALMWTFMGASFPYIVFTGLAEIVGGLLLFTRRTTLLGTLLITTVMTNVVAMNFAYDVPVKLGAMQLLAMALYLLAPDGGRLANVLLFHRAVSAAVFPPRFSQRWMNALGAIIAAVYVIYALGMSSRQTVQFADRGRVSPLQGIYEVEPRQPGGGSDRVSAIVRASWRRVAIERTGFATVWLDDGRVRSYLTWPDAASGTLLIVRPPMGIDPRYNAMYHFERSVTAGISAVPSSDSTRRFLIAYERPDPSHLRLSGTVEGSQVDVTLRRLADGDLLLSSWTTNVVNRLFFGTTEIEGPYPRTESPAK